MARNTTAMKRGFNWDEANTQLNIMVDGTNPMKLGVSTVAADGRAIRHVLSQATPAMSDGYGAIETDFTVTGVATGKVSVTSTWINLASTATLKAGDYNHIHTDGIWDGGATLTNTVISWAKYQCLLASNPGWCSIWELNFDGANSEIDSIFNVNNAGLALGYAAGSASTVIGSVPFFSTAGGALQGWIAIYDAEFS